MIKKWHWLLYPLGVGVVVLTSINILFGSSGLWEKISGSRERLAKQEAQTAKLRAKLTVLQGANRQVESDNLTYLLSVLPARKNLPTLLAEVEQASSVSGAIFEGFKGRVSEVAASESATASAGIASDALQLEVTLVVVDLSQLRAALASLENSLPLVKINKIEFAAGKAILLVEGLWHTLAKLPAGPDYPVVDSSASLAQLRAALSSFTELPKLEIPQTGDVNFNPFEQAQPVIIPSPTPELIPTPVPSPTPATSPEEAPPASP
ncbi:MAG: type 4a pilus biogenesis protein PilO [bacterium]|nr:type 4a pilus biogenesis protein PilO [bacterium]